MGTGMAAAEAGHGGSHLGQWSSTVRAPGLKYRSVGRWLPSCQGRGACPAHDKRHHFIWCLSFERQIGNHTFMSIPSLLLSMPVFATSSLLPTDEDPVLLVPLPKAPADTAARAWTVTMAMLKLLQTQLFGSYASTRPVIRPCCAAYTAGTCPTSCC